MVKGVSMRRFVETILLTALMAVLCIAGCQKIETPQKQETTAARVEKAMAAADITVADVAAFLNAHGMDVVDRSAWMRPHWRPSTVDATHPKPTYYLFRPYIAVADTTVEFMVRRNVSGAWPADVQGVYVAPGGAVTKGPVSVMGWSDNGDGSTALPGVRP